MEGTTYVLETRSDEDEDEEGQKNTDHDWMKELIVLNGEETPEVKSKSSVTKPTMTDIDDGDDDDDDCLVLECDPENIVTSSVEEAPLGSDELVVVGEKGQVACRDYPHPRHLSANFPFSSIPHVKHCEQCHCYVCDSLAPCLKWGTGVSITDHCHATDESKMWKTQRANFKGSKTDPKPASTNYGTLCNVGNPLHNHNQPLDIMQNSPRAILLNTLISSSEARHTHSSLNLRPQNQASQPITTRTTASQNSSSQNQVLRPVANPVCSTTSLATPHVSNQGRYNESVSSLARNRHQPHSVARQLLGVRNHAIQKELTRGAVSLGLQYLQPFMMMSNQVGSARSTLPTNIPSRGPFILNNNHVISAQQYKYYPEAGLLGNNRTIYQFSSLPNIVSYPQQSSGISTLNCVNNNINAYDSQTHYQSNGSQNFYGSCIQGNHASSSYAAHLNRNHHSNASRVGTQNENPHGIVRQNACQQKSHNVSLIESALQEDFSAFDSSWAENAGQNQNISYLRGSRSINQPPNVYESGTQFRDITNIGMVDDIKKFLFDED